MTTLATHPFAGWWWLRSPEWALVASF
jgi:hypothetical protein